jgi:hypothetical protein
MVVRAMAAPAPGRSAQSAGADSKTIDTRLSMRRARQINRLESDHPRKAITSVVGHPSLSRDDERRFRKRLVMKALEALQTPVEEPTLFA